MNRTALTLAVVVAVAVSCGVLFAAEIEIGAKAPDFKATGVDGKEYSLASAKDAKVLVLSFNCNNCPVAKAYEERFKEFTKKYEPKSVKFIVLNCNNRSEDLDKMKKRAKTVVKKTRNITRPASIRRKMQARCPAWRGFTGELSS